MLLPPSRGGIRQHGVSGGRTASYTGDVDRSRASVESKLTAVLQDMYTLATCRSGEGQKKKAEFDSVRESELDLPKECKRRLSSRQVGEGEGSRLPNRSKAWI